MGFIHFDDVKESLINNRLPIAFDNAVKVGKCAEALVYLTLISALEGFSDTFIELEANDPVCGFLENWKNEGYLNGAGALSYCDTQEGKKVLYCKFDLYDIKESLETIESDLFGTVNSKIYDAKLSEDSRTSLSQDKLRSLEGGIQFVKTAKKPNIVE